MPHKEAVYAVTPHPSELAHRVGAVNTFWHEHGELFGHNTDVAGLMATLRFLRPDGLLRERVALLGGGGSAAAALVALDMMGCQNIRLWARSPHRAQAIANRVHVSVHLMRSTAEAVEGATLIVNATPIGMHDDAMPVEPNALDPAVAIADLVYRPGETPWVRACRARGLRAVDGLHMLVEQGAEAFRVWFDVEPSLSAMWAALPARAVP